MSEIEHIAVKNFPIKAGPPTHWFLGFLKEYQQEPLAFLAKCRAYGNVVSLSYGLMGDLFYLRRHTGAYLLRHPTDIKHVLVGNQVNYRKAPVPSAESRLFGKGILHQEEPTHLHQRRLLLPKLQPQNYERFQSIIVTQTQKLIGEWIEREFINLFPEFTKLTLRIIWQILFHQPLGAQEGEFIEAVTVAQRHVSRQYQSAWARMLPLAIPTPQHLEFKRAVQVLESTILNLIRKRRSEGAPENELIGLLLEARDEHGKPLQDVQIRDEVMTLLLAGHETTANALTWIWVLLSQHPGIQERLALENREILGSSEANSEHLSHLDLSTRVWEEGLRLYPPVWFLHPRVAKQEDVLPTGGRIPKGMDVLLSPYVVHRDERWFPEPDRFDPDRFLPAAKETRPQFAYFPFGGGGRRCLGEGLAQLEGLLILATMVQRVSISLQTDHPIIPDPLFTLRPNSEVAVRVHVRGQDLSGSRKQG